jgi:hypothetical protein
MHKICRNRKQPLKKKSQNEHQPGPTICRAWLVLVLALFLFALPEQSMMVEMPAPAPIVIPTMPVISAVSIMMVVSIVSSVAAHHLEQCFIIQLEAGSLLCRLLFFTYVHQAYLFINH